MLRKEEVLNELLERVSAMGIEALGAMERAPSLVEKRVWKHAEPEADTQSDAVGQIQQLKFEAAQGID